MDECHKQLRSFSFVAIVILNDRFHEEKYNNENAMPIIFEYHNFVVRNVSIIIRCIFVLGVNEG